MIHSLDGTILHWPVKLTSERYLQAMKQAREEFDFSHFEESKKYLGAALEAEPNDPTALELRDRVSQSIIKVEQARKELKRMAERDRKEAEQRAVVAVIERAINAVGGKDTV